MKQLVFDLGRPFVPTFANFIGEANAEAVAVLQQVAAGRAPGQVVYLWGSAGGGKSHLLQAAVTEGERAGLLVRRIDGRVPSHEAPRDDVPRHDVLPGTLLQLDHVDEMTAAAQAAAFTLFNATRDSAGAVVAAGRVPPARLPIREDLRTRLSWGLAFEVVPATDDEKRLAIASAAGERGIAIDADVVTYLLHHGPRDLPSLLAAVAALDRLSLASRRGVTVPLVREWLQRLGGAAENGQRGR